NSKSSRMRFPSGPPRARSILAAIADAGTRFSRNDGLAMASHVALSLVIALFPFLICVAALAALLGAGRISTHIIHLLFDFWPEGVAGPLAREADKVLIPRRNVLTISIVLTLLVATNGVESLRIALCRAYGVKRFRPWWQASQPPTSGCRMPGPAHGTCCPASPPP
ncbi:MAG: hypothetical protein K0Q80_1267, partial [Microvirga sp.]|nr:hypothetical protein [Microvirga sp.]